MKVLMPFLLLLFVVACSSPQEEETVKEEIDENYDPILSPYFLIVDALVNDDFEGVKKYGNMVSKANSDTGVKLALVRMGTLISQASSTYDQRAVMKQFGMVIPLYIDASVLNSYPIYKFKCKNEFDGKEVFWLSLSKNSKNPFIGGNSNECVDLVETIEPVLNK